jgi:hypothetical protein
MIFSGVLIDGFPVLVLKPEYLNGESDTVISERKET